MKSKMPVVSIVGWSNSGKTTFLTKMVTILKERGYQVGVIKHTSKKIELDQPGKDSYLHAQAGADAVIIASPDSMGLFKKLKADYDLTDLLNYMPQMDIVFVEGFKMKRIPQIEVYNPENGQEPVGEPDLLIALVSDGQVETNAPIYQRNDALSVTNLIEEKFLR